MYSLPPKSPARPATHTLAPARRLLGALGLSAAGGAGMWLGGSYLIHLIDDLLPAAMRIDALATTAILAVGLILAAWYTLSALVTAACLGFRLMGLVWAGGETWVRRRGAPAMRRFLGSSAGAVVIAGSMLSPAYAEDSQDLPGAEPSAVHLTWVPTSEPTPDSGGGNPATPRDTAPDEDRIPPPALNNHDPTAPETEDDTMPSNDRAGSGQDDTNGNQDEHGEDGSAAEPSQNTQGQSSPKPPSSKQSPPKQSPPEQSPPELPSSEQPPSAQLPSAHDEEQPTTAQLATVADSTPSADAPDERVLVQPGDTLWSIAADDLGPGATDAQIADLWPQWHRANAAIISDPDLIHPGQELSAPDGNIS